VEVGSPNQASNRTICGVAQNYLQLLLARVGVGIGEAGTLPPAHSLIGDYISRPHFSRPLGVGLADIGFYYGWSTAIAAAIGTLSGGPLADYLSRRCRGKE